MKKATQISGLIAGILILVMLISCINPENNNEVNQNDTPSDLSPTIASKTIATDTTKTDSVYKVTFIELGSVRCIPCQKMQLVMKSIEEKYSDQVKIVFYDVWTPAGEPFGDQYGIKAIPTQVFLDASGKEFFRHEGYFPEEELIEVLKGKGVK